MEMNKGALKSIVMLCCWITISPLMLYLGHRWKIGDNFTRVALMLLSPFFFILYLCLLLVYLEHDARVYFQKRDRIERITGVELPKFKVIEYHKGEICFTGDFEDEFTFEFRATPSDALFDQIDEMIASGNTNWVNKGEKYMFDQMWGNGFPAPEGENENEDRFFSLTITRGERRGKVIHGIW